MWMIWIKDARYFKCKICFSVKTFTLARLDEPPTDSVYISHCDIGDGCGAGGRGIMGIIGVGGGNICCC